MRRPGAPPFQGGGWDHRTQGRARQQHVRLYQPMAYGLAMSMLASLTLVTSYGFICFGGTIYKAPNNL